MKRIIHIVALAALPLMAQAGPQIHIGSYYDYLEADKSVQVKRIYNTGDATAFVKVEIEEILYAADGSNKEVPLSLDGSSITRNGLIASPARLIIPSQGSQSARLVFMGERSQERYFRVRFLPVVPEKEDQFAISSAERQDYKETLSAGLNLMTGFGTVFVVPPKDGRYDTRLDNRAQEYEVRNAGNSLVILDELKDCASKDERECLPATLTHIRPGQSYTLNKQAGRMYSFKLIEGPKSKTIEVR
jgi:Mat/Ecp fimbriae periplasmic chaperone